MLIERSIGCAAVIPSALIGFAGLADYAGPQGWRGFAEFFGWAAICLAVSLLVPVFLKQIREGGARRFRAAIMLFVTLAPFISLPVVMGSPVTSMTAKIAFTTSLQIVGVVVFATLCLWIGRLAWSDFRRD